MEFQSIDIEIEKLFRRLVDLLSEYYEGRPNYEVEVIEKAINIKFKNMVNDFLDEQGFQLWNLEFNEIYGYCFFKYYNEYNIKIENKLTFRNKLIRKLEFYNDRNDEELLFVENIKNNIEQSKKAEVEKKRIYLMKRTWFCQDIIFFLMKEEYSFLHERDFYLESRVLNKLNNYISDEFTYAQLICGIQIEKIIIWNGTLIDLAIFLDYLISKKVISLKEIDNKFMIKKEIIPKRKISKEKAKKNELKRPGSFRIHEIIELMENYRNASIK